MLDFVEWWSHIYKDIQRCFHVSVYGLFKVKCNSTVDLCWVEIPPVLSEDLKGRSVSPSYAFVYH